MKINDLDIKANKNKTRKGRGIAAGKGKTAGRGTKGQNARKSGGVRIGFEGGQTPLKQRMPKLPGFTSKAVKTEEVYLSDLNNFKGQVDAFTLANAGIIGDPYNKVKVINKGELKTKVSVLVTGASKSAIEAIKKAGGDFTKVARAKRTKQTKEDKK